MKNLTRWSLALLGVATLACASGGRPAVSAPRPIHVTIWDEQQPAQKQAYENFLGNAIADHLRAVSSTGSRPIEVKSVRLDDPDQGLPKDVLDNTDVLVWWGHQRHGEVKQELVDDIVQRVKAGQIELLALHSAHWSKPFIALMAERAVEDALKSLPKDERKNAEVKRIQPAMRLYRKDEPLTPSVKKTVKADGGTLLEVTLPSCVFTVVRADGKPGHLTTLLPRHPIAKGVPENWDVPQTEVYGGPFHVPTPDAQVFNEKWDDGETFPSGCEWKVGKGHVFYFRPGHETYPIFRQPVPQKVVENAVRWLADQKK